MAKPKIRIRANLEGDTVLVKALLTHPMETGRRQDDDGKLVPAHFIQKVFAECKGMRVFETYWGGGVSKNPFIAFKFTGAGKGDTVSLSWADNQGGSDSIQVTIK